MKIIINIEMVSESKAMNNWSDALNQKENRTKKEADKNQFYRSDSIFM